MSKNLRLGKGGRNILNVSKILNAALSILQNEIRILISSNQCDGCIM